MEVLLSGKSGTSQRRGDCWICSAGGGVYKLNEYIEMAATEFFQETGKATLDPRWIAEFFQDCGVQDDYPMQDLVAFYALVQKALTINIERAEKVARLQRERDGRSR
jgi:hypothetical protein